MRYTRATEHYSASKNRTSWHWRQRLCSQWSKSALGREVLRKHFFYMESQIFKLTVSGSNMTFVKVGEGGNGKLGEGYERSVFWWISPLPYSWGMNLSLLSLCFWLLTSCPWLAAMWLQSLPLVTLDRLVESLCLHMVIF